MARNKIMVLSIFPPSQDQPHHPSRQDPLDPRFGSYEAKIFPTKPRSQTDASKLHLFNLSQYTYLLIRDEYMSFSARQQAVYQHHDTNDVVWKELWVKCGGKGIKILPRRAWILTGRKSSREVPQSLRIVPAYSPKRDQLVNVEG